LELAGAEWPTDGKNHVEELEDGLGAKARAILAEVARRFSDPNFDLDNVRRGARSVAAIRARTAQGRLLTMRGRRR